jgi:type I restriction enzyme M protein
VGRRGPHPRKYQDVILPLTVLRRLDCVLAGTKERVLKRHAELKSKGLGDPGAQLRGASGFAFYNTSKYDFGKLRADAPQLAAAASSELRTALISAAVTGKIDVREKA